MHFLHCVRAACPPSLRPLTAAAWSRASITSLDASTAPTPFAMSTERQYALRYSSLCVRDVEGWLVKEGRSLRGRRSRYVRLRGAVLSSHRTKNAPASWEIAVTNATVARGPSHEWHILLDLPTKHISFVATDKKQFEEWIYALRRASLFSSRVEDYYRVRHIVGEGMNGKVRLGNDLITDETVAIKTVPRLGRTNEDDFLAREVQIMLAMEHPNIVKTFDIFVRRKRIHFVMEYVPGGELFDLVAANTIFTEERAASVMSDLLSAIHYLHRHNIAHRDVKLENLLCMRNTWPLQVKLADFGFANHIRPESDKMLSSFVGTPYYIAPEMLLSKGHGRPVDIWACGVVLYILLSGKFPFGGETEKEYYSRVLSREVYFPSAEWKSISNDAKNLVSAMLTKDPAKRLTADQCLAHRWLRRASPPASRQASPSKQQPHALSSVTTESSPDSEARTPIFRRNRSKLAKSKQSPSSGRNSPAGTPPPSSFGRHTNLQNIIHGHPMRRRKRDEKRTDAAAAAVMDGEKRLTEGSINAGRRKPNIHHGPPSDSNLLRSSNLPARAPIDPITSHRPRPSSMRHSGVLPFASRRQSLIRRLLSSGRVSVERESRFPSFTGADPDDEATALPRKTISLFGKLAPIRRSFHRGVNNGGGSPEFVNSQSASQRLPPKIAREQQRQNMSGQLEKPRRGIFRFRRSSVRNRSTRTTESTPLPPPRDETANLVDSAAINAAAAFERGRRRASASRIMSDTTAGTSQWPDARTCQQRGNRPDTSPRIVHSTSEPPTRQCDTPLSNAHMAVVLGLDESESHCSLQRSSASSFGGAYGWRKHVTTDSTTTTAIPSAGATVVECGDTR